MVAKSALPRRAAYEPLYEVDPRTGASVEVFYVSAVVARSFGTCDGWYWRTWRGGSFPDTPVGPFATSYAAYRNIASRWITPHRDAR
jgi:hypothetical protein